MNIAARSHQLELKVCDLTKRTLKRCKCYAMLLNPTSLLLPLPWLCPQYRGKPLYPLACNVSSFSCRTECPILFPKISIARSCSHNGVSAPRIPMKRANIRILIFSRSMSVNLQSSGSVGSFCRTGLLQSIVVGYLYVNSVGVWDWP